MTGVFFPVFLYIVVSTHMPLAKHDKSTDLMKQGYKVSTHMPLARHDPGTRSQMTDTEVSTHMPLARHDDQCFFRLLAYYPFLLTCLLRGMTMV